MVSKCLPMNNKQYLEEEKIYKCLHFKFGYFDIFSCRALLQSKNGEDHRALLSVHVFLLLFLTQIHILCHS